MALQLKNKPKKSTDTPLNSDTGAFLAAQSAPISKSKKNKRRRRIVTVVVIALAVFIVILFFFRQRGLQPSVDNIFTMEAAQHRNLTVSLSGTGTLEPTDSYTMSTLISGDILSAPFEEGDVIEKDSMLYEFDSSSVASNIETAEINLADSQRNYNQKLESLDDLNVKADDAGTIVSLDIEVGDTVQSGQTIAKVRNSSTMSLTLPFGSDDASMLYIGQQATLTLDGSFETLTGTITKVSSIEEVLTGGMLVRQITIEVSNPGGIQTDQRATAMVGDIACYSSGVFTYKTEYSVIAKVSGEVLGINVHEGDQIVKGQLIASLDSSILDNEIASAQNSLRRSEISLESQYDTLDGYTIKSPIGGTVIVKNYKQGDTLESGAVLCTIFDLSYLTMTLNIDELDISKISVGQTVNITAQAVEGKVYTGTITRININGTTSGGTTTYPVTIRIDETQGLLPGMNVDAVIIVESHENVLTIPAGAVNRGNTVLVRSTDGTTDPGAPEGFKYVSVKTGASDNDYIEILEGLKEGDEVAYAKHVASTDFFGMMGGPRQTVVVEGESNQVYQSEGAAPPAGGGGTRP